jgi:1-acyl-sn-glycerol-3-phosphate acyltransferase
VFILSVVFLSQFERIFRFFFIDRKYNQKKKKNYYEVDKDFIFKKDRLG